MFYLEFDTDSQGLRRDGQLPSRTWHSSEGSTTHHARGPILDPFTLAVQINETFMAHTAAPARNCTPIS